MNITVTPPTAPHVYMQADKAKPFVLLDDMRVQITGKNGGTLLDLTVKKGFAYDGGSVPRPFWWLLPRTHRLGFLGFTVHDELYGGQIGTRAMADAILLTLLLYKGMNPCLAYVAYYAVRAFGGRAWRTD